MSELDEMKKQIGQYENQIEKLKQNYQSELDKMKGIYEEKIRQEKDQKVVEKLANIAGVVKKLKFEIYYIKCKSSEPKFRCPYCEFMVQHGILNELKVFNRKLNLPDKNFDCVEWQCDWADRFTTKEPYGDSLTTEGCNYFYANSQGIDRFPAVDVWVTLSNSEQLFNRIQGIGVMEEENGKKFIKVTLMDDLMNYFISLLDGKLVNLASKASHKVGDFLNDGIADKDDNRIV